MVQCQVMRVSKLCSTDNHKNEHENTHEHRKQVHQNTSFANSEVVSQFPHFPWHDYTDLQ
jgi:hypothetical protein